MRSVLLLLAALLAALWLMPEVPLLGFAAILLALALRAGAKPLARRTAMPEAAAVLAVAAVVALALGLGAWAASGPLIEQGRQLAEQLPQRLGDLRTQVEALPGGPAVLEHVQPGALAGAAPDAAARAASGTLGLLGNLAVIVLTGLYLAARPRTYREGLLALVAPARRGAAAEALDKAEASLEGWLLGQAFAMVVTGLATWLGLWLLGVPLAGLLAVLAAVLGFIPTLGPVLAAVPAVLLALAGGPWLALYVVGLFVVVQTIEGNLLTPLVQERTSDVPPALLLLAQVGFGALFGLLGLALAAPAVAAAIPLVRRGYVQGTLERGAPEAAGGGKALSARR